MAEKKKFYLTEEHAIAVLTEVVHEAWAHKPTRVRISLEGSVDELPMLHVEYDCYAYALAVGKEVGDESG